MYSLRIVNVEYYMTTPIPELDPMYSEFRYNDVQQVPVLRIFGPSSQGIKTCLHIHGVFPYIYIPCPESKNTDSFMYQIATALDKAINISLGETNSTVQHVYKVLLVSGIPFYGYHARKHQFLKILFYNPIILRKACNLLQNGIILGKIYQPHEAHINFTLQFMIDYNLHGMNWINLSKFKYRVSHNEDTPSNLTLPACVKKMSTSLIEIDALGQDIERHSFQVGTISNPGIAALWEDEKQRLRNKNEESQITPQISQSRENVHPTITHVGFVNLLKEHLNTYLSSLDSSSSEFNNSVYPLESSSEANVLNASQIHFSASSEVDELNKTVLDEHAAKFLRVLRDLGEIDHVEEDSILSQSILKYDCDNEEEKQEEQDLNHTLADLDIEGEFWDESFNIPQVDGPLDIDPYIVKKTKNDCLKKYPQQNINSSVIKNTDRFRDTLNITQKTCNAKRKLLASSTKNIGIHSNINEINDFFWVPSKSNGDLSLSSDFKKLHNKQLKRVKVIFKLHAAATPYSKKLCLKKRYKNYIFICKQQHLTEKQNTEVCTTKKGRSKVINIKSCLVLKGENRINLQELLSSAKKSEDCKTLNDIVIKKPLNRDNKTSVDKLLTVTPFQITCNKHCTNEQTAKIAMKPESSVTDNNDICEIIKLCDSIKVETIKLEEQLNCEPVPIDLNSNQYEFPTNLSFQSEGITEPYIFTLQINPSANEETDVIIDKTIGNFSPQNHYSNCFESNLNEVEASRSTGDERIQIPHLLKNRENNNCIMDVEQTHKRGQLENVYNKITSEKLNNRRTEYKHIEESLNRDHKANSKYLTDAIQEKENIEKHISQTYIMGGPLSPTDKDKELYEKLYGNKTQQQICKSLLYRESCNWNQLNRLLEPNYKNGCFNSNLMLKNIRCQPKESIATRCKSNPIRGILKSNLSKYRRISKKIKKVRFKHFCFDLIHYLPKEDKDCHIQENILVHSYDKDESNQPIITLSQLDGCYDDSSSSDEEIKMKKKRLKNLKERKKDMLEKDFLACSYKKRKSVEMTKFVPLNVSTASACVVNAENQANLTLAEKYDINNKVIPIAAASTSNLTPEELKYSSMEHKLDESLTPSNDFKMIGAEVKHGAVFMPKFKPPTREDIFNSLNMYNLSENQQQDAFYSCVRHVTGRQEIGHSTIKICSKSSIDFTEFVSSLENVESLQTWRNLKYKLLNPDMENVGNVKASVLCKGGSAVLEPLLLPPTCMDVKLWMEKQQKLKTFEDTKKCNQEEKIKLVVPTSPGGGHDDESESEDLTLTPMSSPDITEKQHDSGQLTGITLNDTYGFKVSLNNFQEARAVTVYQYITMLLVEVHVQVRGDFMPNPEFDSIRAIFYSVFHDVPANSDPKSRERCGAFVVNVLHGVECDVIQGTGSDLDHVYADSEQNLLKEFSELVKTVDPDIIGGYEIEMASWGYIVERATKLGIDILPSLSRIPSARRRHTDEGDSHSELKLEGRIVLDVWRLMRHEIALQSYTFENIVYHILHHRVPKYSFKDLNQFWEHRSGVYRRFTVDHYKLRVQLTLQLFHQLDLIGRTSELARLFGIQFYEVLSRGSQFRVESMMLRLAKPMNYVAVSPSVQQRAQMRAPEYLPLILEPESKMYVDPVIVLDFQSLYPSMIIAYNYCFSTCLGRLEHFGTDGPFEFGATMLKTSNKTLTSLQDDVNFSPVGVAFVKPSVRKGILPMMLKEILETRLMVKKSMKENKQDKLLQRVLHSRQLGLKLIANVTYGYTAANFSGRMACVEIADSVVSKGRETLERAIKLVESNDKWHAKVVYGDTDSLFVMVKGRTREAAFKIGDEICAAVNAENPQPVKLKLEKVYQPCVLQTKKRYVGYMYESPAQQEAQFEAKGIETVRRDGCPAVGKMLEKSLRILFETKDVSLVRNYVCRQFHKLLSGRINTQDLVFAKEYRGAAGYRPGACVPALELAKKWTQVDKRREPRRNERVPYVIINGPPGVPLIRLVRSPMELMMDPGLSFNVLYYITKAIIPALNRCFTLIGADLNTWFNEMSRKSIKTSLSIIAPTIGRKSTIAQYFATSYCILCNINQTKEGICTECRAKPQNAVVKLQEQINKWEQSIYKTADICKSCSGQNENLTCISLDCPIFYKRTQNSRNTKEAEMVRNIIASLNFTD